MAAVKDRRQVLRGTAGKYAPSTPPDVSPGRADWLIAKTCFACALLLPADAYYRRPDWQGSWSVKCKSCHNRASRKALDARQEASQDGATSKGAPWSEDEIRLAVEDRPVEDIAADLGRTYASVIAQRNKARRRWIADCERKLPEHPSALQQLLRHRQGKLMLSTTDLADGCGLSSDRLRQILAGEDISQDEVMIRALANGYRLPLGRVREAARNVRPGP